MIDTLVHGLDYFFAYVAESKDDNEKKRTT